ncbi:MAG: carboxypeptidase-like regulatory domain-containing protein [Planctomycetes bacterium]|nr:carboxypeptidase-like regulatory domain-containing protein [Planctomycetota bacterium]
MLAQHPRGSIAAPLLLLAALVFTVAWILFQPASPYVPLTPSSTPTVTSKSPTEARVENTPIAQEQRSSDLVKATVTVLLSKPGWAELPESVVVVLRPTGNTPGKPHREHTSLGGALVEFHDLLFGNYQLEVQALGFVDARVAVQVSKENANPRQVVALLPARVIVGEVRNRSGQSVAGIEVSARPQEKIAGFVQATGVATTDKTGRYELGPLPEGRFWVHAGPLLHPINDPVSVEVFGEKVFQDLNVGPLASVSFTITNATTGAFISSARAQIQRMGAGERGHSEYRSADGEGVITFAHIPPGEYTVTVLAADYRTTTRTYLIEEGADGKQRITLIPLSQSL